MNYKLTNTDEQKSITQFNYKKFWVLLKDEKKSLVIATINILVNAVLNMLAPFLIGKAVNQYMQTKQYDGVLVISCLLLIIYLGVLATGAIQTKVMGGVGQKMLFKIRNRLFWKLQELPVDFFYQNKSGDLISRINNDTEKLNQFFSQSLIQFMNSVFFMAGAAVALLCINFTLGAAALAPAILLWGFTKMTSSWVKQKNEASMRSMGNLSAEIQENLTNFKVIVAFNRRDYFKKKFDESNNRNYRTSIKAELANNLFLPVYGFCSNVGQFIVLAFGAYLIIQGHFTVGFLISFLTYISYFYDPLRRIATLWTSFQVALAAWDRISHILSMQSNLPVIECKKAETSTSLLSFKDVTFKYPNGPEVLKHINFKLEMGKTYAFVGPTGGGKTTTASLISRLYDPTKGTVFFEGKDIRCYRPEERARNIGFILQDPFLFSGTVLDNIIYGNDAYSDLSENEIANKIAEAGIQELLDKFENGGSTTININSEDISLGQKQLIAFMRAVLRKPKLLILDEATANIDTVSEQLLENILQKLPDYTTKVIIAHRLNTIENADEIYFVNSGTVVKAGSPQDAVNLLLHGKRES